jgi:hypothetical protein
MRSSVAAAIVYVTVLLVLDVAARRHGFGLDWWRAGVADAALIRGVRGGGR